MKKIFLTLAVIAFAFATTSGCGSSDANNDGVQTDDTMDQPVDGEGEMTEEAVN
jgi:uncharacterized protein YceK